ncbi:hypothetical protein O6P43_001074 [Quillaja saponaria]|uniref:Uncharacterized protein n=1 Tax=Quillaja saponaria TaxID=32244 RepID=A0AAD7QHZ1_QUISA|nr:hypothetical protein O6P43_001074 [Quillaja saponaria]
MTLTGNPTSPVLAVQAREASRFQSCGLSLRRVHPRNRQNLGAKMVEVHLVDQTTLTGNPTSPVLAILMDCANRKLITSPTL